MNPATSHRMLFRAKDAIDAALVQAMLEGEGVRAWTVGGGAAIGFGELPADSLMIEVYVREEDVPRALELIEDYFAGRETSGGWRCPDCGAAVSSDFDVCWSCGAEHVDSAASPLEDVEGQADLDLQTRWRSFPVLATRAYLVATAAGFAMLCAYVLGQVLDVAIPSVALWALAAVVSLVGLRWVLGSRAATA